PGRQCPVGLRFPLRRAVPHLGLQRATWPYLSRERSLYIVSRHQPRDLRFFFDPCILLRRRCTQPVRTMAVGFSLRLGSFQRGGHSGRTIPFTSGNRLFCWEKFSFFAKRHTHRAEKPKAHQEKKKRRPATQSIVWQ